MTRRIQHFILALSVLGCAEDAPTAAGDATDAQASAADGSPSDLGVQVDARALDTGMNDGCERVTPSEDPDCDRPPLCPQPAECEPGPGFVAEGFYELSQLPNQAAIEGDWGPQSAVESVTQSIGQIGEPVGDSVHLIFPDTQVLIRVVQGDALMPSPPIGSQVRVLSCGYASGPGTDTDLGLFVDDAPWIYFGRGYLNQLEPCSMGLRTVASPASGCGWMPATEDHAFAFLPQVISVQEGESEAVHVAPGHAELLGEFLLSTSAVFGRHSSLLCGDGPSRAGRLVAVRQPPL